MGLMLLGNKWLRSSVAFRICKPTSQTAPQRVHIRLLQLQKGETRVVFSRSTKVVQKLHAKDGVPIQKYELIYRCTFPNYILMTQASNFVMFFAIGFWVLKTAFDGTFFELSEDELTASLKPEQHQPTTAGKSEEKTEDSWRNLFGIREGWQEYARAKEEARQKMIRSGEMPIPQFTDSRAEVGTGTFVIIIVGMIALMYSIMKFQQTLPMRIYTSKSGHSIGVFLGNIVPGVTTQQEFVAGTLSRAKTSRLLPSTSVFQDPAGRKMILFERMFRYPADFNRLLGIQHFKRDKEEES